MMIFEVGKFYRHSGGGRLHILCEATTTMFGDTLIAEEAGRLDFKAVGSDETNAANWTEISESEWMRVYELNTNAEPLDGSVGFSNTDNLK